MPMRQLGRHDVKVSAPVSVERHLSDEENVQAAIGMMQEAVGKLPV
jgi:hypothetical protein